MKAVVDTYTINVELRAAAVGYARALAEAAYIDREAAECLIEELYKADMNKRGVILRTLRRFKERNMTKPVKKNYKNMTDDQLAIYGISSDPYFKAAELVRAQAERLLKRRRNLW